MNTHTTRFALVLVLAAVVAPAVSAQNSREFIVANDTFVEATLEHALDTDRVRDGDRFTAMVTSPEDLRGAILHGRVADAKRSGRISGNAELMLEFDRIGLPDGRSYRFAGTVERVKTRDGTDVEVDDEGEIKRDDSQTDRTVRRTTIGAIAGAIIGGIAGGGDAAAAGAAIGGGAGAGSVAVQGRRDLVLPEGTRMVIRASAPLR
jgi:hypothetical protein